LFLARLAQQKNSPNVISVAAIRKIITKPTYWRATVRLTKARKVTVIAAKVPQLRNDVTVRFAIFFPLRR